MLRLVAIMSGLVIAGVCVPAVAAGRVDITACKKFEAEKAELDKTNLSEDVERGPEWGKTNLSPQRLRKVGRFIYLEEQLKFRCPEVFAAAAVRQMEEQARLKALAALERARLWAESMKKVLPPGKKPKTKVARFRVPVAINGIPPLPERKSR